MSSDARSRSAARLLASLLACVLASAAACGGGHDRSVTSVTLDQSSACLLPAGTVLLVAEAQDSAGIIPGQTATWESDAPSVATVDGTGVVTGVGAGTANIRATVDGVTSAPAVISVHPPPAGLLAYSALDGGSGRYQIRTVDLDGSGDSYVADGYQPRMSPDGSRMAFLRTSTGADIGPGDSLYDLDLTGTRTPAEETLYANTTDYVWMLSWTPDGTQVVYDWQNGLYRVAETGGSPSTIVAVSANDDCPDVNPAGDTVAFHDYTAGLLTVGLDGSGRGPVPGTIAGDVLPRWSPDGEWLSFSHLDAVSGKREPARIRPDGTGLGPLLPFSPDAHNYALGTSQPWTPDGAWILVLLVRGDAASETQGIWALASDGSGCMVPVPATQASTADDLGTVR